MTTPAPSSSVPISPVCAIVAPDVPNAASSAAAIVPLSTSDDRVAKRGAIADNACCAAQPVVATAATQAGVSTICSTPRTRSAAARSTPISRLSPTGPCRIAAWTMSGRRTSPVKLADPSTLAGVSIRGTDRPASAPAPGPPMPGSSGKVSRAASSASAAKRIRRVP